MANNVDVKDAAGATQTMKTTDNAGVHTPHHIVDSSALPTGAATAAKQPALGTAGTASADVLSVQGVASMTPLQVAIASGATAGTEYTEDAAAPANPTGGALLIRRDDSLNLASVTTSDNGDWIAVGGTAEGEMWVSDAAALIELQNIKFAVEDLSGSNLDPVEEGAVIDLLYAVPLGARARSSPSAETGVASGDSVLLNATTKGELFVKHADTIQLAAGTNNIGDVDIASALPAGTNNIGDVDVASLPAIPAGTNLIGSVSAKLATDAIMDGTTALTPKFAAIDAATSGDNTLVAAVTSKKIRVLALFLVAAGAVNARFESGAGGAALTGQMNLVANSGFTLPFNPTGWFETASNTLLNLELSGAVSVDGCLTYVEV